MIPSSKTAGTEDSRIRCHRRVLCTSYLPCILKLLRPSCFAPPHFLSLWCNFPPGLFLLPSSVRQLFFLFFFFLKYFFREKRNYILLFSLSFLSFHKLWMSLFSRIELRSRLDALETKRTRLFLFFNSLCRSHCVL